MALTNRTLAGGSFQAAAALGAYPSPITLTGFLNGNSTSYMGGAVLINNAGTLDEAATSPAGATTIGILTPMSPRRQDNVPLTSATAPAAAVSGQKTTPASGSPDYTNIADQNFAVQYYPLIPGQIFVGHSSDENAANGTDIRANAASATIGIFANMGYALTVVSGAGADQINYATKGGLWLLAIGLAASANAKIMNYVNPQPTSVTGGVFVDAAGNIVQNVGATGTFNPQVIWTPILGALF